MIEIYPEIKYDVSCLKCDKTLNHTYIHWQGVHVCTESQCFGCKKEYLVDFPINQAGISLRILDKQNGKIYNENKVEINKNNSPWFSNKLKAIIKPIDTEIELTVEKRAIFKNVIILNTIDFVYGHSLLELMNLQQIIKKNTDPNRGVVVIIQPMMEWLLPEEGIAEVWKVKMKFSDVYNYFPSLSNKINQELKRFNLCLLSNGYVVPTNENIKIENFTKITPYSFTNKPEKPRITFIWREDPGRIWFRNIYILKAFQKLGFKKILLPFHYSRVLIFFWLMRRKFKNTNYQLTLAGMGKYGKFPNYVDDKRITGFSIKEETDTCHVYSESELVVGVHGSSMLLPSAHSGMVISMMPTKRWGNFAEDLLYKETDPRLALFQRRIIPLNLSILELIDICVDMLKGRTYFIKKFIHSNIDL